MYLRVLFTVDTSRPLGDTLFPYTTLFRSPSWASSRCRPASSAASSPALSRPPCSSASIARRSRHTSRSSPASAPCPRSEEHTSELQSQFHLVCRLLLEKEKYDARRMKFSS